MTAVLATLLLLGAAEEVPDRSELPDQTVVYLNARAALRDRQHTEVLKLWLLRNALASARPEAPRPHDADLRTTVWLALGAEGLCPDGLTPDSAREGGAGLWPVALHNWLAANLVHRTVPSTPASFDAFQVRRQKRQISLQDVLDRDELKTVVFSRTDCVLPGAPEAGDDLLARRIAMARRMQAWLEQGLKTLDLSRVEHPAVLRVRIFDLELLVAELGHRQARRDAAAARRDARDLGLSGPEAEDVAEEIRAAIRASQVELLEGAMSWPADEWLALAPQRRLYLYSQTGDLAVSPDKRRALLLAIIDGLVERGEGGEVAEWLGFYTQLTDDRDEVAQGPRGDRLLALGDEAGFRERSIIALHRGVASLEGGHRLAALRHFSKALRYSDESLQSGRVRPLARRWLAYVLSRYETDDEVLATLGTLVSRADYNAVAEDLVWRAALAGDAASFGKVERTLRPGGMIHVVMPRLRMLANREPNRLLADLEASIESETFYTLRFTKRLVEALEGEEGSVRRANADVVRGLVRILDLYITRIAVRNAQFQDAEVLAERLHSLQESLVDLEQAREPGRRRIDLGRESFAGAVRIAPSDPLPWPFEPPKPKPSSPLTPINVLPIERSDGAGGIVYAWSLTE